MPMNLTPAFHSGPRVLRKINTSDTANHISEITNDISHVNFDSIFPYKKQQMTNYSFKKNLRPY